MKSQKQQNPFHYGRMITDPSLFVGRRGKLNVIIGRLNGSQVGGSSIVGERRTGKSSLLRYLYQPRADEVLRADDAQQVIYLSAQDGECSSSTDTFRATLIRAILAHPNIKLDRRTQAGKRLDKIQRNLNTRICGWSQARETLEILRDLGHHPVICLDEFEALLAFENRFFDGLRDWANEGLLTWITASATTLESLQESYSLVSPFFNLLATIPLGDLAPDEVEELLDRANATDHPFSRNERRQIQKAAQANPYHLQIVASALWQAKSQDGTLSRSQLNATLQQQIYRSTSHDETEPQLPAARLLWPWHLLYGSLILLLLWCIWYDPMMIQAMLKQGLGYGKTVWEKLSVLWEPVGNFGQTLSGWFYLIAPIVALLGGIWKRHSLMEIMRPVWEKLGG